MKNLFVILAVTIWVVLSGVFYLMSIYAPQYSFQALEAGNTLMAVLSLTTFFIIRKQVGGRPQAFVRGVYSASFMKLMVCMVAILIYVLLNKAHIHKPSVIVLFGVYAVYTIAETWILSRTVKQKIM